MNKIVILYIYLLFSSMVAYSQQAIIKGSVLVGEKEELPNATVVFLQQDSLVAGLITDKKGNFLVKIDTGAYMMRVSYVGFEDYSTSVRLQLGGLKLNPVVLQPKAYELGETVVSADKMQYEVKNNQLVYSVPSNVKKTSTDVYQLLTHVPSLVVKLDQKSLDIIGSQNSIVMVNNIRRDSRYISMLRPEDIEKVEVVRNPSIRYGSKNIDGIINIVTKKISNMQRGNIGLQLNPEMEYGFMNASYMYASDKFNLSFMGQDFFFNEKKTDISIFRESIYDDQVIQTYKYADKSRYKMNTLYLTASMDYILSSKTFMTLDAKYNGNPQNSDRPYTGHVNIDGVKQYDLVANNFSDSKYNGYTFSYYWQTKFDEKNMLNLEADYSGNKTRTKSLYEENGTNEYAGYTNDRLDKNSQDKLDAQLNYSHKFGNHKFESGYRFYWQSNDFDGRVNNVLDQMQYKEFRNYLYAGMSGSFKTKWSYQVGLGYDFVNNDVSGLVKNDYREFTPNARLGYAINQFQNINIDYARKRTSPAFSNLNPNRNYSDTTWVYYGNPYLTPYYSNTLRLNYQIFKSRFYIMGTVGYQQIDDYIVKHEFLDNAGVYNVTFGNTGQYSNTYFNLNFSVDVLKGWKIMANGEVKYNMYEDDQVAQFNKNFWSASLWVMSMVNYKKVSANFSYFPFFRTPTLTGYEKPASESSIQVSYMLNPTISFTAGFRYLVPVKFKLETYTDNYKEITKENKVDRSWRFMLGININLQKGQYKNRPQKSSKQYYDNTSIDVKSY